ncbi:MAG: hypothetical protein [Podoviridae sp. cty5g4]|nr:MAG: hypothetical protein [Podoviridae sp. cty5g4]
MPLTASGNAVLDMMEKHYGKKKGMGVFYASIKKKKGTKKWHKKKEEKE